MKSPEPRELEGQDQKEPAAAEYRDSAYDGQRWLLSFH